MTRGESLSGQLRCTLIDSLSNRKEQLRGVCLLTKRIFFQDPFDASVMVSEGPKYPVGKKNSWKLIWQGETNFIQLSIH